MERFLNLKFLKYPISLLISMVSTGFFLYVFPASATEDGSKEKEKEFEKVNTNMPSVGTEIEGKSTTVADYDSSFVKSNMLPVVPNTTVLGNETNTKTAINQQQSQQREELYNRTTKAQYNAGVEAKTEGYRRSNSRSSYKSVDDKTYKEQHGERLQNLDKRINSFEEKKANQTKHELNNEFSNMAGSYNNEAPSYFSNLDLSDPIKTETNGFYSNNAKKDYNNSINGNNSFGVKQKQNKTNLLVKARIYETKTVHNGTSVKIIVAESKKVGGYNFVNGQIISAKANIANDRLYLSIESAIIDDDYVTMDCTVIDLDGQKGLRISSDYNSDLQKKSWGQNVGNSLSSVNPLLVYSPQGNLANTVANQVVGSLTNQALNGANQYVNAKVSDFKVNLKSGHNCYLIIKSN